MKLKHFFLLVAAFTMTFNMSLLAQNQTDQNLAKGYIFAWTAVMLAHGQTTKEGLGKFTTLATVNEITKKFYSDGWFSKNFEDGLKIFKVKGEGTEGLIKNAATLLATFNKLPQKERVEFMITLLMMANYDRNVSKEEADVIEKIANAINISRDDLLMAWMLWAQRI